MSEPGTIKVFQGLENNRAGTVDGMIFVELLLPDGSVIPTEEVYGEHFSVRPLGREGRVVTFDIGAITDQTGEMALHFRCEEEGTVTGSVTKPDGSTDWNEDAASVSVEVYSADGEGGWAPVAADGSFFITLSPGEVNSKFLKFCLILKTKISINNELFKH